MCVHAHVRVLESSNQCLQVASVVIGVSASLNLVDKFCYLGVMLSVYRNADAAMEARI